MLCCPEREEGFCTEFSAFSACHFLHRQQSLDQHRQITRSKVIEMEVRASKCLEVLSHSHYRQPLTTALSVGIMPKSGVNRFITLDPLTNGMQIDGPAHFWLLPSTCLDNLSAYRDYAHVSPQPSWSFGISEGDIAIRNAKLGSFATTISHSVLLSIQCGTS